MADELIAQLKVVLVTLVYLALYVGPFIVTYLVYLFISLPMRRRERARLLLHLIETGAAEGCSPERTLIQAASSRDRVLGKRFYDLAAFLEAGVSLREALDKVPRVFPPEVAAMLRVGCELGDVRRVLPACHQLLNDSVSQTRGALNYLPVLGFILLPVVPVLILMSSIFVLPKFELIAKDMGGTLPPLTAAVFGNRTLLVVLPFLLMLAFQMLALCFVGGPRLRRWFAPWRIVDRLFWTLPWRRNRLKRDFTTLLSLLLDAGVPEARAVKLAAEGTANAIVQDRAGRVAAQLSAGATLTEALAMLDDSGELRWRFANAKHGQGGFFHALRGWLEALDARSFQQEQSAAQITTTALVLFNGLLIGAFVVAMISMLVSLTEEAPLW